MLWFDARTVRVLNTLLLFGLGLLFIDLAWRTLLMFLFAILFAYLLEPVVAALQRRLRLRRGAAVAVLYALLVVVLGGFSIWASPSVVRQATRLADTAPTLTQRLKSGEIVHMVGQQRGWSPETQNRVQQLLLNNRQLITTWINSFATDLTSLVTNAWWVVLIPLIAIFFLLASGRFSNAIVEQLAKRRQRAFLAALLQDIHNVLASYIRAQITLTALAVVVYVGGLLLLRVPYAITLGVTSGLLEFIPVVGPITAVVVILVTAFFTNYPYLWAIILFLGVWRIVQDYLVSPHVMGGQVQLPPLAVLFGVLAGAEVAGITGVYLSVPIMATLRVIWIRWREYAPGLLDTGPGIEPAPPAGDHPS